MTVAEVGAWLQQLGLHVYAAKFSEKNVDGQLLSVLTAADFELLGLNSLEQKQALIGVQRLKDSGFVNQQPTVTTPYDQPSTTAATSIASAVMPMMESPVPSAAVAGSPTSATISSPVEATPLFSTTSLAPVAVSAYPVQQQQLLEGIPQPAPAPAQPAPDFAVAAVQAQAQAQIPLDAAPQMSMATHAVPKCANCQFRDAFTGSPFCSIFCSDEYAKRAAAAAASATGYRVYTTASIHRTATSIYVTFVYCSY